MRGRVKGWKSWLSDCIHNNTHDLASAFYSLFYIAYLISLTPQLISKPTPPGETIASGSSMLKAAVLPMAKPYPECTSGKPIEYFTMPGKKGGTERCIRN